MDSSSSAADFHGKQLRAKDLPDGSRVIDHSVAGICTLSGLREQRLHRRFCDVKFQVEGAELVAHRCILVMHSDYFQAMFTEGFREGSSMCTVIPLSPEVVDRQSAEALLNFMYSGQLTMTADTVQRLIMAAEHWQMSMIKEACMDFMELQIDINNCLGVLSFAELYRCKPLILKCHQLIKQKFHVVCQTTEFLHLSAVTLAQILSFTDLTLGPEGEDVALEALMRWLEYDSEGRLGELPTLLKVVRLSHTSQNCRDRLLHDHRLIQGNEEIKQLMDKLLSEETEQRRPTESLCVINGFTEGSGRKSCKVNGVERVDPVTRQWISCADFPMKDAAEAMAFTVRGRLFVMAYKEHQGSRKVRVTETEIFEYRSLANEWLDAKPCFSPQVLQSLDTCLQAEGAIAVCLRTNTIYAISHSEASRIPVELSPDGDVCARTVHQLPQPPVELFSARQRSFAVVVAEGRLYVLGGDRRDGDSRVPSPSSQVLMFDPESNVWVPCASMLEPRAKLAAVFLDGRIYACGGFNEQRLKSMERYDPVSDTWTQAAPMRHSRSHHQLVVANDYMWVLGGKSSISEDGQTRSVIAKCELYNLYNNTWWQGPAMKAARYGFAAATS